MIYTNRPKVHPKWYMGKIRDRAWCVMPFNLLLRLFSWIKNG